MPEENGGGNGKRSLLGVIDPNAIKQKAADDLQALKKPTKTDLYKSIFRVKHDEKPRSRTLGVLSNVFLHLHPAKINRDAVRYNYTWGMGGITFYLFVVLTWTGVLLMFYYHPTKVVAFRGAGWSPDSRYIYYVPDLFSGIWRVRMDGGGQEQITGQGTDGPQVAHYWPEVLPGGEHILYTDVLDTRVMVRHVSTDSSSPLIEGAFHAR